MIAYWTPLSFGKYYGLTAPQIALRDPDYVFWAEEEANLYGDIGSEVHIVATRASNIRVRPLGNKERVIEYIVDPVTGNFVTAEFSFASAEQGRIRSRVIDLGFPRRRKRYDKLGGKNLLACVKEHLFGSSTVRITKKLAEDFFADDDNFSVE